VARATTSTRSRGTSPVEIGDGTPLRCASALHLVVTGVNWDGASTVATGVGQTDDGRVVTFAGDWRPMQTLAEAVHAGVDPEVDVEPYQIINIAHRHAAENPAYPNGRCPVCGQGLDDDYKCQNEDCSNYGKMVPQGDKEGSRRTADDYNNGQHPDFPPYYLGVPPETFDVSVFDEANPELQEDVTSERAPVIQELRSNGSRRPFAGSPKTAGNPYGVGSPAWFRYESGEGDEANRGPMGSGAPDGGIPLHGDLTPEQEAWMSKGRTSAASAIIGDRSTCSACGNEIVVKHDDTGQRDLGARTPYGNSGNAWADADGFGDDRDFQCGLSEDRLHHPIDKTASRTAAVGDGTDAGGVQPHTTDCKFCGGGGMVEAVAPDGTKVAAPCPLITRDVQDKNEAHDLDTQYSQGQSFATLNTPQPDAPDQIRITRRLRAGRCRTRTRDAHVPLGRVRQADNNRDIWPVRLPRSSPARPTAGSP
jgi:hypothetical protein